MQQMNASRIIYASIYRVCLQIFILFCSLFAINWYIYILKLKSWLIDWLIEASRRPVQNSHVCKLWKLSHFDRKSWVNSGTKIRQGKVGNWNIWVKLTQTLRVKLTQHWESNWLNIESQIDSTLRVKLTQHWDWRQIDSNILQLPTLLGRILVPPLTQLFRSKWLNFFSKCIVLAYTRFSWSIKFVNLDWYFFDKYCLIQKVNSKILTFRTNPWYGMAIYIQSQSHFYLMLASPFITLPNG